MPLSLPTASEPTITVSTKTAWAGAWVEQPLLTAVQLSMQAAPAHPSAVLAFRYGKGMLPAIGSRPEDAAPATIARGDFLGNYVRIEVTGLGTWYGVIIDNSDRRHGELPSAIPSGIETYTAMGLTWFLDQVPIFTSLVKYSSGAFSNATHLIQRVIPFNGGTGADGDRDQSAWKNYDETDKCFTDRTRTPTPVAWKAKHAVEYVIANHAPKDADGDLLIPFSLHASALTFLDYELPLIAYDGRTPWQLLNMLIDRRRGLGWHAIIEAGAVKIVVWSQSASAIVLPGGGGTVPANPTTTTYNFDTAVNIRDATVQTTLMARFDQVVVRGERASSVFSVRPQTNFAADWTTADKNKYNQGASLTTGFDALSDSDKEAASQDARAADAFARVFSWWKIKDDWDGRSATNPASGTSPFAFPEIDSDGADDPAVSAKYQRAGLRCLRFLPMLQGVDYTKPITPQMGDQSQADFLPPLLALKVPPIRTAAGSPDEGWVHCERLNQAAEANSSRRPFSYSVDLGVREDALGLVLRTVGKPQHYLAKDQFVPNGAYEDIIAGGEGIAHDQWLATICVQQDQYCRAQWPAQEDLPELDLIRTLNLMASGAHLDYIVPGTIVSVESGELKKTMLGGWLRDDRKKLKDIARVAFSWYGQERRILNLSFRGITTGFDVGTLITTIGSGANLQTINTTITCVTYNLQDGTTQLHTDFGELQFT